MRRNVGPLPLVCLPVLLSLLGGTAWSKEPTPASVERGYQLLTTKAYMPPRLDQALFDELWKSWEPILKKQAAQATPGERQALAMRRYGLTPAPIGKPRTGSGQVQYVVDKHGGWTMNCFSCHQGEVAGRVIAGVPNTRFALQTLNEDIRNTRLRLEDNLRPEDLGSMLFPSGSSNGTTNAVMFGVILKHYRDANLNLHPDRPRPKLTHHDMDAPAWWHFKKKKRLYADGFAPKSVRALMPFLLAEQNGPEKFRQWEDDFRHIYAWLESIDAPDYPFAINASLAKRGEEIFLNHCADCHGTYGERETYPEKVIPLATIGTDPVRLSALTPQNRRDYAASWFAQEPEGAATAEKVIIDPPGYIAPPLDGIWASAPYFHNGAVPTLWHVLHPEQRPALWRRSNGSEQQASEFKQQDGYDRTRNGLAITEPKTGPHLFTPSAERRQYFDTSKFGKSAAGHTFPDDLNKSEKAAVLEYLKTL